MEPDFTRYTLALIKDDKIIHSSNQSGLRPLFNCILKYKDKYEKCTLYDKVTGLAGAKLIVYSGLVSSIKTLAASQLAKDFLEKHNIKLEAKDVVKNILNNDKTTVCHMELVAQKFDDLEKFFLEVKKVFG